MRVPLKQSAPCPCGGAFYGNCCRPLHRGERQAPTAVALMRSRYSAFALGEVAYLWKTLAPEHIERKRTESRVLADLRESTRTQRFMGLHIEAVSEEGDSATVTFFARVFRSGKERSFRETSLFRRVDGEWRYVKVM